MAEPRLALDRWIVDNDPSPTYPIYTRANSGEVYPDPVSPLSGTLQFLGPGEAGWRDTYVRYTMNLSEFDLSRTEIIGCFGGYVFLNMSLTRLFGQRMPGMTPEQVDFQYFGEMPGIPAYSHQAWHDDEERSAALGGWVQGLLAAEDLPELREERALVDDIVRNRPDLGGLSDAELVARVRSFVPLYRSLFDRHITISAASGFGVGMVAGVMGAVGRPEHVMTLFAGMGDVDSAAPSFAMWELARQANASEVVTKELDAGVDGLLDRLGARRTEDGVAPFLDGVAAFIEEFGSRGPNEWELRSETWGTRPALFLAAVDRMRLAADDDSPTNRSALRTDEAEAERAAVAAMVSADEEAAGTFGAGLRSGRLHLQGRERTKTTIIKIVHEMRLAARELGRRAAEAGHLTDAAHVFMLKEAELDEFVAYPEAWGDVLAHREEQYLALWELEPPFILDGVVPPLSEWSRRDRTEPTAAPGDVLTGISGCPGVATGRARVILDPSDPGALEPGDILVAPITDPAWTPLFVPAAAVVVDVGAQISHAVIVSRELGLPCVVSVTGATRRIPDGAMIQVDGTSGTVTLL
jgi:phosphohistidine swiveling domain-containing protein